MINEQIGVCVQSLIDITQFYSLEKQTLSNIIDKGNATILRLTNVFYVKD